MIPEHERRTLFHGWTQEETRSRRQKEALRLWLNQGVRDERNLHHEDLEKIRKAEGNG